MSSFRMPKPKPINHSEKTLRIYVSSEGIETVPVETLDASSGKRILRHFLRGSINGVAFQIPCNEQVDVSENVARLLQPLISRQNGKQDFLE